MNRKVATENQIVEFLRKRDYLYLKDLGQGACGKTVLLRDEQLQEDFVCKKYVPFDEAQRETLYNNFVNEIRLLLKAHHPNVVRFYNYHLYPQLHAGYILMEHVNGTDIDDYLRLAPERANDIFTDAVRGFRYLESISILHRDIRPANIMVTNDGVTKIIDLGFGKRIGRSKDFDRSISLNWWCEPPPEFESGKYDFCTEVYFVGKLFEKLIQENGIQEFKYAGLLREMCQRDPDKRLKTFADVERSVETDLFIEIDFSRKEKEAYRAFSAHVHSHVRKIAQGVKYIDDIDRVQAALEAEYRKCMLEETVPDAASIISIILGGGYYYRKAGFPVDSLSDFIRLLKSVTHEKRRIIFSNLHTKLDTVPRYNKDDEEKEDIPF